jgi:hypothetical protein
MSYRYIFYKYEKYTCPNPECQRESFVRYVDTTTGELLSEEYGKCDHVNSCRYWKKPSGYNSIFIPNPEIDNLIHILDPPKSYIPIGVNLIPKKIDYIDRKSMLQTLEKGLNSFTAPLLEYLDKNLSLLDNLVKMYNIGTFKDGSRVIFWQVDAHGRVRTGKVMLYNEDINRVKKDKYDIEDAHIGWVHNYMRDKTKKFNQQQCLFGEHLLTEYPNSKSVIILESEKSAIVLKSKCMKYNDIIMAAGTQQGLTADKFKVFQNRNLLITLIPDVGSYSRNGNTKGWYEIGEELAKELNLNIRTILPDNFIKYYFKQEYHLGYGDDIADYILDTKRWIDSFVWVI